MELLALLLTTYTAIRIIVDRGRWVDIAYIVVLTYLSTVYTYAVIPLAVPYLLAVYAIRRGKLAEYAGFGSALSFTGVIIMTVYANAPHLLALGFVMATLAPAVLLPALGDRGSLEGLFRYLLISSISSSLLISGLSLRSVWSEIAELLIILAIMTELGIAPIFIWVVDVYSRSSATGLALLASLPKLAAAYALIAIRPAVPALIPLGLGALSMLIGNLGALTSRELNKVLAYSSVLHGGFAIFIYPVNPPLSLAIMLADALGKMALFYYADGGSARWASLVMVMNQIGVPPTLGFWPKLFIIISAVEAWGWVAGAYLLANIVMSVPYYIRVFQSIPEGVAKFAFISAITALALGVIPNVWIPYILSL